jgi:hypothetical protein
LFSTYLETYPPFAGGVGAKLQARFDLWLHSKRAFTFDELIRDSWEVRIPRLTGAPTPVAFHQNGKYLSSDEEGSWYLSRGILRMKERTQERYLFVASTLDEHSGLLMGAIGIDYDSYASLVSKG